MFIGSNKPALFCAALLLGILSSHSVFIKQWSNIEYFIYDDEVRATCEIFDHDENLIARIPFGLCNFYSNGDMVGINQHGLLYFSRGQLKWKTSAEVHHDVHIDPASEEIVHISHTDIEITRDTIIRHDAISIYDRAGNRTFYWRAKPNYEKFLKWLPQAQFPYATEIHTRTGKLKWLYSHFNYVQVLPPNEIEKSNPAFRAGNLLVGDWGHKWMFIIGRKSQEIEWGLDLRAEGYDAPHTAQLTQDGKIYFFVTSYLKSYPKNSGLSIYDIRANTFTDYVLHDKADHSRIAGSAFQLTDSTYLISLYGSNRVLSVNSAGKVVGFPLGKKAKQFLKHGPRVFRVRKVKKNFVDRYLEFQGF